MSLLERFVERVDFESYEDFKQNFKLKVPKDFNFGFIFIFVRSPQPYVATALAFRMQTFPN